jgi:hypothetical protein
MPSRKAYIAQLDRLEIPIHPPFTRRTFVMWESADGERKYRDYRQEATSRGMWALVYRAWVEMLADWIEDRQVLEIMAGRGWLAKALKECGVQIIATDDGSWDERHSKCGPVCEVITLDAIEAVEQIAPMSDVLIVSWPPYGDETISRAVAAWGEGRPIVYIGERHGGCNAPDSFWQHWREDSSAPEIPLAQWEGLHDIIEIGYYVAEGHHICPDCGGWQYSDGWCCDCSLAAPAAGGGDGDGGED